MAYTFGQIAAANDFSDIYAMGGNPVIAKKIKFNKNTYFVIVTRGHKDDRKCLQTVLKNDFYYVRMIGSKGKVAFVLNNMLERGYTKGDISKVHTPIGLRIGAQTPAEIAVSILGEIIQVKNEKLIINIDDNILNYRVA